MRLLSIPGNEHEKILKGYSYEITYNKNLDLTWKESFDTSVLKDTTLGFLSGGSYMKPTEIVELTKGLEKRLKEFVEAGGVFEGWQKWKPSVEKIYNKEFKIIRDSREIRENDFGYPLFHLKINESMKDLILKKKQDLYFVAGLICYQAMEDL